MNIEFGASNALQRAIYEELHEIAGYTVIDGYRKNDIGYPYIQIGEEVYQEDNTKTNTISEHNLLINIWDDEISSLRIKAIMADCVYRLKNNLQTVDPYCIAMVDVYNIRTVRSENDATSDLYRTYMYMKFSVLNKER